MAQQQYKKMWLPHNHTSLMRATSNWEEAIGWVLPSFDHETATLADLTHEVETQGVLHMETAS